MTLGELITALEAADPRLVLPHGFTHPHSYRGYYEQLAFEPAKNVTIGEMLADAQAALGGTFWGYKGGDYEMTADTDCWIANQGSANGEQIGPWLIGYLIAAGRVPADPEPEPDPSDPRQIAVSLMLDAARSLDSADVWDAVAEHHPHLDEADTAILAALICKMAETANITIGWAEATK